MKGIPGFVWIIAAAGGGYYLYTKSKEKEAKPTVQAQQVGAGGGAAAGVNWEREALEVGKEAGKGLWNWLTGLSSGQGGKGGGTIKDPK
jgi:hypothetical protein